MLGAGAPSPAMSAKREQACGKMLQRSVTKIRREIFTTKTRSHKVSLWWMLSCRPMKRFRSVRSDMFIETLPKRNSKLL